MQANYITYLNFRAALERCFMAENAQGLRACLFIYFFIRFQRLLEDFQRLLWVSTGAVFDVRAHGVLVRRRDWFFRRRWSQKDWGNLEYQEIYR